MTKVDITKAGTDDPFHHLHDETYAAGFAARLSGPDTFVAIGARPILSLAGDWRLTLDLFDEGLRQHWYALDDTPPSQWAAPRDYEIEAGELVPVPSCWTVRKPEWTYFEGAAWYTRALDWQRGPAGERVLLNIGAANYLALVFLNGAFVGGHQGGSTPFTLDVTDGLKDGTNRLQIMVENRRMPDRVPMHHIDWFNHGGLYREVSLMRLPALHIKRAGAALLPGGKTARFFVLLSQAQSTTALLRIPELGIEALVPLVAGTGELILAFPGTFWSPDNPKLYDISFAIGEDVFRERVGFRTIETCGTDILLNGKRIWLKGVCVHEDHPILGKVSSEADVRQRFRDAREMGCNFLRLAHYPHHEHAARIADEVGLLLWAEIPVYWAIAFDNPKTYADAENQLQELIARDINRASIILWGVGNENADTDARLSFLSRLARAAKTADPSRLIGAACLINRQTFAIEDRLAAVLDVIGLNEYFGWYEPDFAGLDRLLANSCPDKPVLISETGADAVSGLRGTGRQLFTEDWQAEFYRQQFVRIAACPYIAGMAAWLLYDFPTERRQTSCQKGYNRKGLITADRKTRKAAFQVLGDLYRGHAAKAELAYERTDSP